MTPAGLAAPRPRVAGARLGFVAAAVVALAATGIWLAVGLTPHLEPGSYDGSFLDPEAAAPEGRTGDASASTVTDPSDGTNDAVWSFRNAGPAPVVVRLAPEQPGSPFLQDATLFAATPEGGLAPSTADPVDAVRLAPGEHVGVRLSVGFGCATWGPGTGTSLDAVELRVTTLGLTRAVTVRSPTAVGVTTTHARTGGAPPC